MPADDERKKLHAMYQKRMASLTYEQQKVLEFYYDIDTPGSDFMDFEDIAEAMGKSKEEIERLHEEGLIALRKQHKSTRR
jgi:DNA-directed RNA polymerase specialized sigma subunit